MPKHKRNQTKTAQAHIVETKNLCLMMFNGFYIGSTQTLTQAQNELDTYAKQKGYASISCDIEQA